VDATADTKIRAAAHRFDIVAGDDGSGTAGWRSFAVDRGAIGGYALSHEAGDALGSRGNFRFDDRVRRS
jgi:hypothetical protein